MFPCFENPRSDLIAAPRVLVFIEELEREILRGAGVHISQLTIVLNLKCINSNEAELSAWMSGGSGPVNGLRRCR
jgi:hypothetical protein